MRKFRIEFSLGLLEETNKMMRKFDVGWGKNDGVSESATITTSNELPFADYKKLIEKAFAENGGKLYHIEEIIT